MLTYEQLMQPLLKALTALGGSGNIEEIYEKVVELENIEEQMLEVMHNPEKSNQTEIQYRLAWGRTYLKKSGYLENSSRGVWALTEKSYDLTNFDSTAVVQYVRSLAKQNAPINIEEDTPEIAGETEEEMHWREQLHHVLINEMTPDAFERLTQRLLRESGFAQVEVTGRTGDGGIDGKGIARINGMLSFHIVFQCKKYSGTVSSPDIRNFRGAMDGRGDRGLFITTGRFSPSATKEATRDGAAPIDLIDGDQLADKLKELGLGLKTEIVEKVIVDSEWFKNI